MMKFFGAVVAAAAIAVAGSASAAVHMYTSQADYLAAAGPNDTYGFKKFWAPEMGGDYRDVSNPLTYGAVTFTGGEWLAVYQDNGYYIGSRPTLDLDIPLWNSLAFDYGSYYGSPEITVTVNGQAFSVEPDVWGLGKYFVGFTSDDPITSIRVEASHNDIAIFNFYRSSAVPEPATWAMMIIGFGMVGGVVRRRRCAPAYAPS